MKVERIVFDYPIWAEAVRLTEGWDVGLFGGSSTHVGAVTLAEPDGTEQTVLRWKHKEEQVTRQWALRLAALTEEPVSVRCGIHYDNATKEQLSVIISACEEMLDEISGMIGSCSKNGQAGITS